jgi:hypothetical protein
MSTHPDDAVLHDFVDGRLTDNDREAVAFHLLDCQRCQAIVAATEELIDSGRAARAESAAPADLWSLVAATTIHERAVRRHVLRSVRRELAIAAVVLMILSGAAGALGMRIALRAENGWGSSATTIRHVDRVAVAPEIAIATHESVPAAEAVTVLGEGVSVGVGGHPPHTPAPPQPPSSDFNDLRALALATDFISQLMARESRAFNDLRGQVRQSRIAQIEDSLFLTNRKLTELRIAYESDPRDSTRADEVKALFDERIALIRAAAAEAEARTPE